MKKHLLTISAVLAAVVAAQAADKTLTVTVTNPSKTERRAVPVVIEVDDDVRSALVTLDGKEIPFTGKIYVSDDCEVNMNMSYENSRMIHINGSLKKV